MSMCLHIEWERRKHREWNIPIARWVQENTHPAAHPGSIVLTEPGSRRQWPLPPSGKCLFQSHHAGWWPQGSSGWMFSFCTPRADVGSHQNSPRRGTRHLVQLGACNVAWRKTRACGWMELYLPCVIVLFSKDYTKSGLILEVHVTNLGFRMLLSWLSETLEWSRVGFSFVCVGQSPPCCTGLSIFCPPVERKVTAGPVPGREG